MIWEKITVYTTIIDNGLSTVHSAPNSELR
jgi:hypothetical protein